MTLFGRLNRAIKGTERITATSQAAEQQHWCYTERSLLQRWNCWAVFSSTSDKNSSQYTISSLQTLYVLDFLSSEQLSQFVPLRHSSLPLQYVVLTSLSRSIHLLHSVISVCSSAIWWMHESWGDSLQPRWGLRSRCLSAPLVSWLFESAVFTVAPVAVPRRDANNL